MENKEILDHLKFYKKFSNILYNFYTSDLSRGSFIKQLKQLFNEFPDISKQYKIHILPVGSSQYDIDMKNLFTENYDGDNQVALALLEKLKSVQALTEEEEIELEKILDTESDYYSRYWESSNCY